MSEHEQLVIRFSPEKCEFWLNDLTVLALKGNDRSFDKWKKYLGSIFAWKTSCSQSIHNFTKKNLYECELAMQNKPYSPGWESSTFLEDKFYDHLKKKIIHSFSYEYILEEYQGWNLKNFKNTSTINFVSTHKSPKRAKATMSLWQITLIMGPQGDEYL